jgi:sorbitol-specific phosphotransferase system component IIC
MLHYPDHKTFFTPVYYSIVTYTTLGFGDVTPRTVRGELFVTLEVIIGYLTLGLLISILANKVARRS